MKYTPVLLLLTACATEPVPVTPVGIYNQPDPAARVVMQCRALGFSDPQTERLCILRGIDKLAVYPSSPGITHIPLLPYPYPPLAPGGSANPYGYTIQGVR